MGSFIAKIFGDTMKLKHHALAFASLVTLGMVTTAHAAKVGADFEVYGNFFPQYQSSSYSGGTTTSATVLPKSTKSVLADKTQVTPVNSYIGFKASRKFGEIRAGFDLQGNISTDENAKDAGFTTKPRNAFVFVEHQKLGKVTMGQMDTIYKMYGDRVRMLGVSSGNFVSTSSMVSDVSWKGGDTTTFNTRVGQHLSYETAKLNGFKAGFSQSKPWDAGKATTKKLSSVGANWSNKTYYVGLAQETHNDYLTVGGKDTANRLSLGYTAGKLRVGMDFASLEYNKPSSSVSNYKTTTWQVTGQYALTKQWTVAANYAKGNAGSCTLVSGAACTTDGLGGDMMSLGARYDYDKDIGIFMLYGKKNANANASYNKSAATMYGGTLTDLAVGVQFKF
jgi:hypothetical protein